MKGPLAIPLAEITATVFCSRRFI